MGPRLAMGWKVPKADGKRHWMERTGEDVRRGRPKVRVATITHIHNEKVGDNDRKREGERERRTHKQNSSEVDWLCRCRRIRQSEMKRKGEE